MNQVDCRYTYLMAVDGKSFTFLVFLLAAFGFIQKASAQNSAPPGPAPVILIVMDDVSAYGAVRLGREEFGDLKDSPDGGFYLPATSGKLELRVKAQGCADQPIVVNLGSGRRYLLTLQRAPNPDPKTQGENPNILRHELIPLEGVPEAKGKAQVAALYLRGNQANLTGSVVQGLSEARRVDLPKGRVVTLGQGKTGMKIGGQQLIFCNPGEDPLVYLFVLLEQEGVFRVVQVVF